MLTGSLPFTGPTPFDLIQQHINAPMPPLAARRAGLPAVLDKVIGQATAKDPQDRYHDVSSLLDDFRRALDGGLTARPVFMPSPDEEAETELVNPYKGLRAFNEADSEDFFGRESLIQQLLARLGEGGDLARFLAVVGPSGSGKSSVVKAGLIPILRRGGLPGSENWFIVDLMPGPHPFEELEAALLRVAVNPPESLLAQLKDGERGLLRAVNRILPSDESVELVLVIDQFEEVFTLVAGEEERALLLSSLVAAVLDERSRVRVILTLRADFTDRPLRYVDFGELVQRRSEFVMALTPDELERAILGPAKRAGLRLEAGLTSAMIREVGEQPGALPLLQYALTELFEKREGRTLTKAAYQDIGGVAGALGRRAEEVFAGLSESEQALARQLFLRLVTLGEGVEDTRRRVLRSELESLTTDHRSLTTVLDTFGKHRLLSFDRDPVTRGPTVEVAHEALLREWARLREWLNESRADLRLQRQLANAAHEWGQANRDESFLLTGAHLEQFEGWAGMTTVALTHDERAYLDASIAEGERKQTEEIARQGRELELTRTSANRLRYLVGALTIFLLAAIGLTAFAFVQQNRAEQESRLSASRELAAAAVNNIGIDPNLSILLALQALDKGYTREAEEALHRTVASAHSHIVLSGHESSVTDVAYSPDGTRLATTSLDGTAKTWDTTTGKELLTLGEGEAGHGSHGGGTGIELYTVAFSPDGQTVATAGQDGMVMLWDVTTSNLLFSLGEVSSTEPISIPSISSIDFSPDGQRLAAAYVDGTVHIWDLATRQILLTLSIPLAQLLDIRVPTNSVAFSPDGKRIATVGSESTAQLWDAVTGEALLTFTGHERAILSLAFSPDGKRLATASYDTTTKIWNVETGEELLTLSGHAIRVSDVAFSPDGTQLVTVSADGTAKVWDASAGQELFFLTGHTSGVQAVAFSPDGTRIATAGDDTTARIWEAAPSRELVTLLGHTDGVIFTVFSPDGTRLLTTSEDNTARLWDAVFGQLLFTLPHPEYPEGAAFSPDGKLVATGSYDDKVRLWDAMTGQLLLTLSGHEGDVGQVAFSPDGKQLASTSYDKTVKFWDVATGQELFTIPQPAEVHCLDFSPDGKRLIVGGTGDTAIVWDIAARQEVFRIPVRSKIVYYDLFSPDGTRIIIADNSETATVWDAATGQLIMELVGHGGAIAGAAWSRDGKYLATASANKTAKIWDAASGQPLLTLYGHTAALWGVSFSPDGTRIATISDDHTARIYTLRLDELIAIAQSRVTRGLTVEECKQYLHVDQCLAQPSPAETTKQDN